MITIVDQHKPQMTKTYGKRILMVDSNEDLLNIVRRFLSRHGFIVDTFTDGQDALECFSHNLHDLVLTDIKMPGVTGVIIAAYIRSQKSGVPIIALTGTPFLAQGQFDEVLSKPVELNKLLRLIQSYFSVDRFVH
jgi:DNA-binding response OmpR family regulator